MPKLKLTQSSKAHLSWTWAEDGEGLTTLPLWTQFLNPSNVFCSFVWSGPLNIYHLGGGWDGWGRSILFESEWYLPDPPLPYWHTPPCSLLATSYPTSLPLENRNIPPLKKIPPPHRWYRTSVPFTFPPSPYFIQTGIFHFYFPRR